MMDRRKEERSDGSDRRSFPRPPLWLNLAILIVGTVLAGVAWAQNRAMEERFQKIVHRGASTSAEIRKIRDELSKMDLTGEALKQELASRTSAIKDKQSSQFYLSVDTQKKVFGLYYGVDLVREAPVTIGSPATIRTDNGTFSFPPIRGMYKVERKHEGLNWKVPDWIYVMNRQPKPASPQRVRDGIGEYIIELPNGYLIHSEPAPDSPLKGPKPGSFMVPAETLRAIWPRVREGTRVYIF